MKADNFNKIKTDEEIYAEIKSLYEENTPRHLIAKKMGIDLPCVDRCCNMVRAANRIQEQTIAKEEKKEERKKKEESVSIIVESQNEHEELISRMDYHIKNLRKSRIEEKKKVVEEKEETKEPKEKKQMEKYVISGIKRDKKFEGYDKSNDKHISMTYHEGWV